MYAEYVVTDKIFGFNRYAFLFDFDFGSITRKRWLVFLSKYLKRTVRDTFAFNSPYFKAQLIQQAIEVRIATKNFFNCKIRMIVHKLRNQSREVLL